MKAEELMVGDWILYGDKPVKVLQLSENSKYDWVKPILLTTEILEKNGWVFMKGQDYSTFPVPSKWTYQFVPFTLRVDGETYNVVNTFTIKYVHELQHALRLAGLNDLADSFKVE